MKAFLAFSFRDEDKPLANQVERLLACLSVKPETGERLGGGPLPPRVQRRIEDCDALIALLTRRDQLVSGTWTTHQWVLDERAWAVAKGKPAIALVEDGVPVAGMFQPDEYIPLDRAHPLEALLRLAETAAGWIADRGRKIPVRLVPSEVAEKLGQDDRPCRYRLLQQGQATDWRESVPQTEPGGTFVWIDGVQDDHLIQVKADTSGQTWQSVATPQWVQVELKDGGTAQ